MANFTGNISRVPGEDVGEYEFTIGSLQAGGFDLELSYDVFTILPKPIVITVDQGQNKRFGEPDPIFTYAVSELGVNISGNLVRIPGEELGEYMIERGTLTAGINYDLTVVPAVFSILPKRIVVTPNKYQSKIFGSPNPVYSYITDDPIVDIIVPIVTAFSVTTPTVSLDVEITEFTATDAMGVTGYLITENSTPPVSNDAGWEETVPATYVADAEGTITLYPWAKDEAGNVSEVFGSPREVVVNVPSTMAGYAMGVLGLTYSA